jgi:molybdopterin/thiamine biosynthesis adenylyltransferase
MDDPRSPFFERPMGFYSEDLRQRYIDSSARIAGVGGGGLTLAVMLAKEGVRDFSIADIDKVDATNVGRIPMLTPDDIGRPKVEVAAELITRHNPTAQVRVYSEGVQDFNVDEFLGHDAGNKGITVGFDEIELNEPRIGLILHRAARHAGRYVIAATDVERGGMVTTFDPNSTRYTFEHYNGASAKDSEEEFLKKVKGFQLPTIPNIPTNGSTDTLMSTTRGVSLPTTLRSVLNATDLALDEYEKLLTLGDRHYGQPHIYPNIHAVNPSRGEDFTTRFPRTRALTRIVKLLARDKLGVNPPANYSDQDREAREVYREQVARQKPAPLVL